MNAEVNTLLLRLEGPLQSWGDTSKMVIRRSMEAPTKSGVLGLICCAMGLSRQAARDQLAELNELTMGVRIDRPGKRWWDYHTVGARIGILNAKGEIKINAQTKEPETLVTRREYLADASFLVALQGDSDRIRVIAAALASPKWPVFLGRKACPSGVPVLARPRDGESWTNPMPVKGDIRAGLQAVPWYPRYADDAPRDSSIDLPCLLEWRKTSQNDTVPADAEVWYDAPFSFDPPVHHPRVVVRESIRVSVASPLLHRMPVPPRPRADYNNTEYRKRRAARLEADHGLCVFCKAPATTVQHVTYRRAGGNETHEDLRSLCRLCHDAVTMIEYGLGMGLDRIDPQDPRYRQRIIRQRDQILAFRSLETRRRWLEPQDVE
ncbi:MAG TPA: type I-E CRISPR-associated protein Cas5/CasD [Tepidisphaeraceae bacterium]|nr:type I-E CRISPR-associated protein Cas5/CasD [Tepidisphaeraceae bacterium]